MAEDRLESLLRQRDALVSEYKAFKAKRAAAPVARAPALQKAGAVHDPGVVASFGRGATEDIAHFAGDVVSEVRGLGRSIVKPLTRMISGSDAPRDSVERMDFAPATSAVAAGLPGMALDIGTRAYEGKMDSNAWARLAGNIAGPMAAHKAVGAGISRLQGPPPPPRQIGPAPIYQGPIPEPAGPAPAPRQLPPPGPAPLQLNPAAIEMGGPPAPRAPAPQSQLPPPGPPPLQLNPAPIEMGPPRQLPPPAPPPLQLPPSPVEMRQNRASAPGPQTPGTIQVDPAGTASGVGGSAPVFASPGNQLSPTGSGLDVPRPPPPTPPRPAGDFWREDVGKRKVPLPGPVQAPRDVSPAPAPVPPPQTAPRPATEFWREEAGRGPQPPAPVPAQASGSGKPPPPPAQDFIGDMEPPAAPATPQKVIRNKTEREAAIEPLRQRLAAAEANAPDSWAGPLFAADELLNSFRAGGSAKQLAEATKLIESLERGASPATRASGPSSTSVPLNRPSSGAGKPPPPPAPPAMPFDNSGSPRQNRRKSAAGKAKKAAKDAEPPPPPAGDEMTDFNPEARIPTKGWANKVRLVFQKLPGTTDFNQYLNESGLGQIFYTAHRKLKEYHEGYSEKVAGTTDYEATNKAWDDMVKKVEDRPDTWFLAWKVRNKAPLSAAEKGFLKENPEVQPFVDRYLTFLDHVREDLIRTGKLESGDKGPTFIPHEYPSMGHVIESLGQNWRKTIQSQGAREKLLSHFDLSQQAAMPPHANWARTARKYIQQTAEGLSLRPASRIFEEARKYHEGQGNHPEARWTGDVAQNSFGNPVERMDVDWTAAELRDLASEPAPRVGESFDAPAWQDLPAGKLKVESELPDGRYQVSLNGKQIPTPMSEPVVMGLKHRKTLTRQPVTKTFDRINALASWMEVAGKASSGLQGVTSNIARVKANVPAEYARRGWKESRKPSAELQKEFRQQGVWDDTVQSVTDNLEDTRRIGSFERAAFSNVRLPDQVAREVVYMAEKARLKDAHPKMPEAEIRDRAGFWTRKLTDMSHGALRTGWEASPMGKLTLLFQKSRIKELGLLEANFRDGKRREVMTQLGLKYGQMAALLALAGGSMQELRDMLFTIVPVLGDAAVHGSAGGFGAVGSLGRRAKNLDPVPGGLKQIPDAVNQPGLILYPVKRDR